MKNRWEEIKTVIQKRWSEVSENEIIQSDDIPELASLISRKVGDPQPNIIHELVNLIHTKISSGKSEGS